MTDAEFKDCQFKLKKTFLLCFMGWFFSTQVALALDNESQIFKKIVERAYLFSLLCFLMFFVELFFWCPDVVSLYIGSGSLDDLAIVRLCWLLSAMILSLSGGIYRPHKVWSVYALVFGLFVMIELVAIIKTVFF